MRSLVLHFGSKKKRLRFPSITEFKDKLRLSLKSHGINTLLFCTFILGLTAGAASAGCFDENTLKKLDILFVSNISARQGMNAFEIFTSCFVSCFLFIFSAFLASLSVWGFLALPLILAFNGFTVGLSAAFIIMSYKLAGAGFLIVVVLPGTALFLYDLIRYSSGGIKLSLRYSRISLYGTDTEEKLKMHIRHFIKRTVFAFILAGASAVLDMLMWCIFADKFEL